MASPVFDDVGGLDGRSWLLNFEINHPDFVENGRKDVNELHVFVVGKVGVAVGFVCKGDEEAVREAVVLHFGAVVDAEFEAFDQIDFAFEGRELLFDLLDLFGGGVVVELEEDDVLDCVLKFFAIRRRPVVDHKDLFHLGA